MKNKITEKLLLEKKNRKIFIGLTVLIIVVTYFMTSLSFQYVSGAKIYVNKIDITDTLTRTDILTWGFGLTLVFSISLTVLLILVIKFKEKKEVAFWLLVSIGVLVVASIISIIIAVVGYTDLGL